MAQSIEQLSFELTANALAEQERALSGLRMCASTAVGAASVAGSFLGASAIHGSFDAWSVLALLSFGVCFGSAIWVLRPHDFAFAFRGETILAESDRRSQDMGEAYRAAGAWIEAHMDANSEKIADLSVWLTVSCASLAAEVVLWTLSIVV
jgi:hypothetical protein